MSDRVIEDSVLWGVQQNAFWRVPLFTLKFMPSAERCRYTVFTTVNFVPSTFLFNRAYSATLFPLQLFRLFPGYSFARIVPRWGAIDAEI